MLLRRRCWCCALFRCVGVPSLCCCCVYVCVDVLCCVVALSCCFSIVMFSLDCWLVWCVVSLFGGVVGVVWRSAVVCFCWCCCVVVSEFRRWCAVFVV